MQAEYDVIVVGAGNAAFSAAHAACEQHARVCMVEKAPREWLGGNSYFTAGAFRTTYGSLEELRPLLHDFDDEEAARVVLPPYTSDHFRADMRRVTHGRSDPDMTEILVTEAAETTRWLKTKGIKWRLMYERQSYEVDGKHHFWGGLTVGTVDGGKGLIAQHLEAAERNGVDILVETPVTGLLTEGGRVAGVTCRRDGVESQLRAKAVVIAAGGFEADPLMRAQYLGPRWDIAKVRGTPYNSGEVLKMALDIGAQPCGHWSGSHAIQWGLDGPDYGDLELTNQLSRQGYPIGIVVNADAVRFIDEGADFRNYTYARYGAAILEQPGAVAYQLFDAKTQPLLSPLDYAYDGVMKVEAKTIAELAEGLGLNPQALEETVEAYNEAVQPGDFNPAILDGKGTRGVSPPKSNWAQRLDTPPYVGFPVTCGVTFTFGGVRIDADGRVMDRYGEPIPGLHAAGELVGGLFFHNYPGGSGLMAGSVFGRRAGRSAGELAKKG